MNAGPIDTVRVRLMRGPVLSINLIYVLPLPPTFVGTYDLYLALKGRMESDLPSEYGGRNLNFLDQSHRKFTPGRQRFC